MSDLKNKPNLDVIFDLHKEQTSWLSQLLFYKNEIAFFQKELDKVLDKNIESFSKIENVSEYQAILHKKLEALEKFEANIHGEEIKILGGKFEEIDLDMHQQLGQHMSEFIHDFEEIKKTFKRFASHND